jgi:hypothetical protein
MVQCQMVLPVDQKLVIAIDGLENLSMSHNAHKMFWVPTDIPSHLCLILGYVYLAGILFLGCFLST